MPFSITTTTQTAVAGSASATAASNLDPIALVDQSILTPTFIEGIIRDTKDFVGMSQEEQETFCMRQMQVDDAAIAFTRSLLKAAILQEVDLSSYSTLLAMVSELQSRMETYELIAKHGKRANPSLFVDISRNPASETLTRFGDDLSRLSATLEDESESITKMEKSDEPIENTSMVKQIVAWGHNQIATVRAWFLPNILTAQFDDTLQEDASIVDIYDQDVLKAKEEKDLEAGLVAYYPFTDGSVADMSGNGHHSEIVGNVVPSVDVNGKHNNAMTFDGSSYIKGSSNGFPSSERTISLWFYDSSFETNSATLFAYGGNPCGTSYMMSLNNRDNPGTYEVQAHCRVDRLSANYQNYPNHVWHHWVITTDLNGMKMYLDLALIANNSEVFGHTNTQSREFALGVNISPTTGFSPYIDQYIGYFTGILDEVRIYDYALSHERVVQLYFQHKQPSQGFRENGLLAYYPFGGSAQNAAQDDFHGTVFGATLVNSPFGQAYQFDGVDDYIEISSDGYLEPEELTVSFWAKFTTATSHAGSSVISCHAWPSSIESGWGFEHWNLDESSYFVYGWGGSTNFQWNGVGFGHLNEDRIYNFSDNVFRQFTFTVDSNNVIAYVNGTLLHSNPATNMLLLKSYLPLRIGNLFFEPDRFLNGTVDEVRIYNRSLNADEVLASYWSDLLGPLAPTNSPTPSPSPSYSGFDLNNGLIAYYSFDGNSVEDMSANHHHGSIVGNIDFADGVSDRCLSLDGQGFIEIADHPDFHDVSSISYSLWFKTVSNGSPAQFFLAKHLEFYEAHTGNGDANQITALPYRGIGLVTAENAYSFASWHHLVVVYDPLHVNNTQLYLDGKRKLAFFNDRDGDFGEPIDISSTEPLRIGTRIPTFGLYSGKIDEVRIYNRPLNYRDIQELFAVKTSSPSTSGSPSSSFSATTSLTPSNALSLSSSMTVSKQLTRSPQPTLSQSLSVSPRARENPQSTKNISWLIFATAGSSIFVFLSFSTIFYKWRKNKMANQSIERNERRETAIEPSQPRPSDAGVEMVINPAYAPFRHLTAPETAPVMSEKKRSSASSYLTETPRDNHFHNSFGLFSRIVSEHVPDDTASISSTLTGLENGQIMPMPGSFSTPRPPS